MTHKTEISYGYCISWRDRKDRIQEAYHSGEDEEAEGDEEDEEEADWEEMQIRKAMNKVQIVNGRGRVMTRLESWIMIH